MTVSQHEVTTDHGTPLNWPQIGQVVGYSVRDGEGIACSREITLIPLPERGDCSVLNRSRDLIDAQSFIWVQGSDEYEE